VGSWQSADINMRSAIAINFNLVFYPSYYNLHIANCQLPTAHCPPPNTVLLLFPAVQSSIFTSKLFYMKKIFFLTALVLLVAVSAQSQVLKNLGDKAKNKANQRVDQNADRIMDKTMDNVEDSIKNGGKGSKNTNSANNTSTSTGNNNTTTSETTTPSAAFKTYQNYDFIPGEKILFEDNFLSDADGEFAAHWELQAGQAVVNKVADKTALLITEGNYGWVTPFLKQKKYLGNEWTVEFDNWRNNQAYPIILFLQDENHNDIGKISISNNDVTVDFAAADGSAKSLDGSYPENMNGNNFLNKWHHIAIAYKNKQIKVYVDQARVVVVPNSNIAPDGIAMGGIGSPDGPLVITNVRIADGAGMNMLGKKFTDTKIITHGINFDVNKAVIKPESMGTLNGIVQIMKDNPDIKFEIGGHTDSDGDDALNMKLSQSRADAVRVQLISMGIDASRLTAKGYGKTKPISDNTTAEGKANNRRVEFVKK
jgi:OOP family OmpA-OmpF porin